MNECPEPPFAGALETLAALLKLLDGLLVRVARAESLAEVNVAAGIAREELEELHLLAEFPYGALETIEGLENVA